ncbi:3320_t:CDS:2 [Dentiscutata heterogama]|uniref:3320_t:CDS:1 n=1 Tax=Dentiscutata heterogama TaxID=1316150 RepID=A0ACA9N287_9GLOM|nr:3320_t:CDS:2 [Dentiscutata heterogama]
MSLKDSLLNTIVKGINEDIVPNHNIKTEEIESSNLVASMDITATMDEKSVMPTLLHTHPIFVDHNDQYLVLNRRYGVLNRVKSIDECQTDFGDNDYHDNKISMTRSKEITEINNSDYIPKTKGWMPKGNGTIQRMTSIDSNQTRIDNTAGFEEDHEIIDSEISDEEQLLSKMLGYFPYYKSRETSMNHKVDDEFIMIPSEGSKIVKKAVEKDCADYDTDEEGILVDPEIEEQEFSDIRFSRKKNFATISESSHSQLNSPEFTTAETISSCTSSSPPSPTFLPSNISLNLSLHVPKPKLPSNNLTTKMSPWTSDEDKLLIDAVLDSLTPSWIQISENIMMQRSEDACRSRWARLKKRLYGSA